MPKIPTYERQIERSTQGEASYALPGEHSSPLRIPSEGGKYSGMQVFSEKVTKIGERMVHARNVEQYSRALVAANEGLSKIARQVQEDPALMDAEPEEYERVFRERAAEAGSSITAGIKDVQTRSKFSALYDDKVAGGAVEARDLGRKRMISRGRAATDSQLESLVDSFVRTGDPKMLAEGASIITGKQASGFFSPEEATQLGQRFSRAATVGYWERRILDSPRLAYEMLQNNPESIQGLPEGDRTRLLVRAKEAGERWEREDVRRAVYAEMKAKYGRNLDGAVDHLENPENYKDMDLEDRRYLIAAFDAEITRDRERVNQARVQGARQERRNVLDLLKSGDYDKAVALAEASENLSGEFVEHVYTVARKGKNADVTIPQVYTTLIEGIRKGTVTDPEQVDAYRLRGLSNDAADKLADRLGKEKRDYKEAIGYAEAKFKALYPAKDNKEKHLKWFEFVNFVDQEMEDAEKSKGRRLTQEEARKIVDSWIDPQVEERAWWFDKTRVPFFDKPSSAKDGPSRALRGIPLDDIKRIEKRLVGLDLPVSEENIRQYWQNNRSEFFKAGR